MFCFLLYLIMFYAPLNLMLDQSLILPFFLPNPCLSSDGRNIMFICSYQVPSSPSLSLNIHFQIVSRLPLSKVSRNLLPCSHVYKLSLDSVVQGSNGTDLLPSFWTALLIIKLSLLQNWYLRHWLTMHRMHGQV